MCLVHRKQFLGWDRSRASRTGSRNCCCCCCNNIDNDNINSSSLMYSNSNQPSVHLPLPPISPLETKDFFKRGRFRGLFTRACGFPENEGRGEILKFGSCTPHARFANLETNFTDSVSFSCDVFGARSGSPKEEAFFGGVGLMVGDTWLPKEWLGLIDMAPFPGVLVRVVQRNRVFLVRALGKNCKGQQRKWVLF